MAHDQEIAIGIDLGTTYSVVGVYRKNKTEIIAAADTGSRTTPSYVHFADSERYVGEAAKEIPSSNTVYDSKRMIGRRFDDPAIQDCLETWPFTVINDGGVPKYEIEQDGLVKLHAPEEVSAIILEYLKGIADAYLMMDIKKAVITVPAYFNESQRQATKDAARIAGLEVIGLLNEPSAAAMYFGQDAQTSGTVLVFDFGGGTFDVSIMRIAGQEFQVVATGGDAHLGGQDLDKCLLEFVIKDIRQNHKVDVGDDPSAMHELRAACELAKRKLSTRPETYIKVYLPRPRIGYEKGITRSFFESLCGDILKRTVDILPQVLKDAKMQVEDIDEVILVGGSTRIPKVRALVKEFFGKHTLRHSVNPDEAVAGGAAIRAASLTGQRGAREIRLKDTTSLSLGVATFNGLMATLIPRNTPLPASATKTFTTAHDDQDEAEFTVVQGERAKWEDNTVLGNCTMRVPQQPKGSIDIKTTFYLDSNGLLTVTAVEETTGEKATVNLESENRLSNQELERILADAKKFKEQDRQAREEAWKNRFSS